MVLNPEFLKPFITNHMNKGDFPWLLRGDCLELLSHSQARKINILLQSLFN